MATGEAEHGRHDNGLAAAGYIEAGPVDAEIGARLLDVLAADGIAAYLQDGEADVAAIPRPRLYVDQTRLDAARGHLDRIAVDPAPDVESEFARIVAGYHLSGEAPHDVLPAGRRRRTLPQVNMGISVQPEPSLLDGLDTFGADLDDDDDERYVPPPPPPMPRLSKFSYAGLAAVLVGFVLLVSPSYSLGVHPDLITVTAALLLVAGAAALVMRLRPRRDDTHDPDDGAVV